MSLARAASFGKAADGNAAKTLADKSVTPDAIYIAVKVWSESVADEDDVDLHQFLSHPHLTNFDFRSYPNLEWLSKTVGLYLHLFELVPNTKLRSKTLGVALQKLLKNKVHCLLFSVFFNVLFVLLFAIFTLPNHHCHPTQPPIDQVIANKTTWTDEYFLDWTNFAIRVVASKFKELKQSSAMLKGLNNNKCLSDCSKRMINRALQKMDLSILCTDDDDTSECMPAMKCQTVPLGNLSIVPVENGVSASVCQVETPSIFKRLRSTGSFSITSTPESKCSTVQSPEQSKPQSPLEALIARVGDNKSFSPFKEKNR